MFVPNSREMHTSLLQAARNLTHQLDSNPFFRIIAPFQPLS